MIYFWPIEGGIQIWMPIAGQYNSLQTTRFLKFAQCQITVFLRNKPGTQFADDGIVKSLVVELSLITALEFMYIQNDEFIGVFIEEKVQAFE